MHASLIIPFLPAYGRLVPAAAVGMSAIFASSSLQDLAGGRELILSLWFGIAFGIFPATFPLLLLLPEQGLH